MLGDFKVTFYSNILTVVNGLHVSFASFIPLFQSLLSHALNLFWLMGLAQDLLKSDICSAGCVVRRAFPRSSRPRPGLLFAMQMVRSKTTCTTSSVALALLLVFLKLFTEHIYIIISSFHNAIYLFILFTCLSEMQSHPYHIS